MNATVHLETTNMLLLAYKNFRLLPLLLVAFCLVVAGCRQSDLQENEASENQTRNIFALGRLEPAGGIISISAGIPGERLKQFDPDVQEGALAPKDGILGLLGSYDLRSRELDALQTQLALAKKQAERRQSLAGVQVLQAQATWKEAVAKKKQLQARSAEVQQGEQPGVLIEALAIAKAEYDSLERLSETDPELVTPHQLRRQRNARDRAASDLNVAIASHGPALQAATLAVEAAKQSWVLAQTNERDVIDETEALVKQIAVAKQALAQSVLWGPDVDPSTFEITDEVRQSGICQPGGEAGKYTVLKILLRAGESVTGMPIMQLGNLKQMVCVAEVYFADAKNIRPNQSVTITSHAFDSKFAAGIPGTVESISSMVASPGLSNRNPLAPVDRSVVEVRILIDPNNQDAIDQAAKRVGLQVTVRFDESTEPPNSKTTSSESPEP